jgi:hypothetical protein
MKKSWKKSIWKFAKINGNKKNEYQIWKKKNHRMMKLKKQNNLKNDPGQNK